MIFKSTATTYTVGPSGQNYSTISEALQIANAGDEILVAGGTYSTETGEFFPLQLKEGVRLGRLSEGSIPILDAQSTGRVMEARNFSTGVLTVVDGFKLINGKPKSIFQENIGGGVLLLKASVLFVRCTISNCEASMGGGVFLDGSQASFVSCTIRDNQAEGLGGGVYAMGGSPLFDRSKIIYNECSLGSGGGILLIDDARPIIKNCDIINNTALVGGGISSGLSEPLFYNCNIAGNKATGENGKGGAAIIFGEPGEISGFYNCSFHGNTATLDDGAISVEDSNSYVVVVNSILWTNEPGFILSDSLFFDVSYSNVQLDSGLVVPGAGNMNEDPLLEMPGIKPDILAGSPCIDTGIPDTTGLGIPHLDLNNNFRVWDGNDDGTDRIDMGCLEYDAPMSIKTIGQRSNQERFKVFPNPASNEFRIELTNSQLGKASVLISNTEGSLVINKQIVFSKSGVSPLISIDLAPGLYTIQIRSEKWLSASKMIVF